MELRTEMPEITAKTYLSVGPGEYPCDNGTIGSATWDFLFL
jgi:hypothetical protein